MADITVTPANVRPLPGYWARNAIAGEALDLGDVVYLDGVTGRAMAAQADDPATSVVVGIVVAVGNEGKTAAVAGEAVSVVLQGVVQGYSGMTPGSYVYLSAATAGAAADDAGTVILGIAWAADMLLLRPQVDTTA
jgi:hypothetical protein